MFPACLKQRVGTSSLRNVRLGLVLQRRMEGGRGLICAFRRGYFSFLLSFLLFLENAPTMQAHSPNDSGRCRSWNLCTAQLCPRLAPCPSIVFHKCKIANNGESFSSTNFSCPRPPPLFSPPMPLPKSLCPVCVLLLLLPRSYSCGGACSCDASSSKDLVWFWYGEGGR